MSPENHLFSNFGHLEEPRKMVPFLLTEYRPVLTAPYRGRCWKAIDFRLCPEISVLWGSKRPRNSPVCHLSFISTKPFFQHHPPATLNSCNRNVTLFLLSLLAEMSTLCSFNPLSHSKFLFLK
jgi:hypothetical protein